MIPKEAIEAALTKLKNNYRPISEAGKSVDERKLVTEILTAAFAAMSEPVAFRCRDYADGWILYHSEREAIKYQQMTGCLMQPLYAAPQPVAGLADMPAHGAKVKSLEWEDKPGLSFAKTSIGTYFIRERHGYWKLELDDAVITASDTAIVFPSLRSAKAAAQADYEKRILSALEGGGE